MIFLEVVDDPADPEEGQHKTRGVSVRMIAKRCQNYSG
jgi:hypothetical protein